MADLKIAVMLGSLRMEPDAGLEKIAEMGVTGVHLSCEEAPFRPQDLDQQDRRKLRTRLDSLGLELSALSGWGRHLENDDATEDLSILKAAMELAVDLECDILQSHVGVMPEDENDPGWINHVRHHTEIAEYGEKLGVRLAIETGPEPPYVLKRLIESVGSDVIRINWDPANLIMRGARTALNAGEPYDRAKAFEHYQPVEGLTTCGQYVIHAHAKDALLHPDGKPQEVPFGAGWVDWDRLILLLHEKGFDGYVAIEREVGDDPVADIQTAVDFLKGFCI